MKLSATETPNTHLTFPDGSIRTFPAGVTGLDVAESISKTLAKRTVAVSLIGKIIAASDVLESGRIEIICSGDPRANVTEALNAAHKAVCAELRTRLGDGVMVLHELEPNSDAVKFVNALNEGKFSTATPAKPEAITAEQLRNEALNVVRQIANGRPPESSLQYDAALYLLEHAYRIAD
ncbi:hypothetical protein CDO26_27945 (plasmid) [Sinorhizobium meliloti]|nr:hypothetical protein CDO26_27945 [Sinorhizobium meliloti]MQW29998.1 TGS domain-containing protein [Sinorhizobium meliloti]